MRSGEQNRSICRYARTLPVPLVPYGIWAGKTPRQPPSPRRRMSMALSGSDSLPSTRQMRFVPCGQMGLSSTDSSQAGSSRRAGAQDFSAAAAWDGWTTTQTSPAAAEQLSSGRPDAAQGQRQRHRASIGEPNHCAPALRERCSGSAHRPRPPAHRRARPHRAGDGPWRPTWCDGALRRARPEQVPARRPPQPGVGFPR